VNFFFIKLTGGESQGENDLLGVFGVALDFG
jgi:hypothetical protein